VRVLVVGLLGAVWRVRRVGLKGVAVDVDVLGMGVGVMGVETGVEIGVEMGVEMGVEIGVEMGVGMGVDMGVEGMGVGVIADVTCVIGFVCVVV
jgi:hypothetical protein